MKVLSLLLKVVALASVLIALVAFGSDLLPVEGVNLGARELVDDNRQFYKIVPTDGVNPTAIGAGFLLAGVGLFVISALIKKYLVK